MSRNTEGNSQGAGRISRGRAGAESGAVARTPGRIAIFFGSAERRVDFAKRGGAKSAAATDDGRKKGRQAATAGKRNANQRNEK